MLGDDESRDREKLVEFAKYASELRFDMATPKGRLAAALLAANTLDALLEFDSPDGVEGPK